MVAGLRIDGGRLIEADIGALEKSRPMAGADAETTREKVVGNRTHYATIP